VYVADTNNHRIVLRSLEGEVLRIIEEEPGELEYPVSVTVGPFGYLFVLEARRNRVKAYTAAGEVAFVWDGTDGELWLPVAVTADERYIYVMENDGHAHARVQVFTVEKEYPNNILTIFADNVGANPGQVWDPHEIAVSSNGKILIADSGNDRLQLFAWPGTEPIWIPSPTPTPTDPPWPTATPLPVTPTSTLDLPPTSIAPTADIQPTPVDRGGRTAFVPSAFSRRR
jgi:hypothetical protein